MKPTMTPPDAQPTLFVQKALGHVKKNSNKPFATWYDEKGKKVDEYTFHEIWNEAGYIANALRNKWNVKKGDLVVLCYDFGIHFFAAFIGCQRAGVTAVIVYPPSPPLVKSLTKMNKVIEDCSPTLILTDSKVDLFRKADIKNPFSKSRHLWPSNLSFKVTSNVSKLAQIQFDEPDIKPSDLAFLQYTSGSTGNPKGVMVTQSALSANIQVLGDNQDIRFNKDGIQSHDVIGFSWLPQYHDLGLIGFFITPLARGWRMHFMSPITFIKNPLLWIDLMSQHKVHFSAGPDFAYQLTARKFKEAKKHNSEPIAKLDLSSICYLINAAEPIRLDTKDNFVDAFGNFGLSEDWFTTSYGLAESVVGVSWLNYHFTDYEECGSNGHESKHEVIAIGERATLHPTVTVKIVHPDSCMEMKDGQSGEIWVSGPSVAAGYYGRPELSKEVFQAQVALASSKKDNHDEARGNDHTSMNVSNEAYFLRTGDKGFFKDGRLFICGRYKDLIIVNGVNYYPNDIENVTQAISPSAVRPGCCAAFSSDDTDRDGELVIVFELRSGRYKEAQKVCLDVQSGVSRQIGLFPTVVAIQERTICKTTSGKIQRRQNRTFWHEGKLKIVHQVNATTSLSPESHLAVADRDSDALVIGAGVVGLCFARDLASIGYKVTIVEKSSEIGGTWANNDYHGLRLHQTGATYRCLSLAPKWTKQHPPQEHYRPYRDEILQYCYELADHPNITVYLNSVCDYEEVNNNVTSDGHSIVTINSSSHKTKFVLVSKGCYVSNAGQPIIPIEVPKGDSAPLCLHSSQMTTEYFEKMKKASGKVVVVGSGKAAIDILQSLDPSDSVVWAHRGHTAFLNRDIVEEAMKNDGIDYYQQLAKYKADAQKLPDVHPSALAVQDGYFLKCKGPLTKRRAKTGSGLSTDKELSHCDKFNQFDLRLIAVCNDGNSVCLESSSSNKKLLFGKGDCIIFCTGQKNQDWEPAEISQYHARTGSFEESGPLNALVPLRVAIDQLRGQNEITMPVQEQCQNIVSQVTAIEYQDPRELEIEMISELRKVYECIFPSVFPYRMTFRHEWIEEWYGKDLEVDEVFNKWYVGRTSKNIGPDNYQASLDSFLGGLFGPSLDDTQEWAELDVTSIQSVELSSFVSKQYGVQLPPNFMDIYPTIADLKNNIIASQRQPISMSTPDLVRSDSKQISWNELMVLQSIGVVALLVMITVPIVLCVLFSRIVEWYLLPCMFPIWMFGYTILLIIIKWLVIGRYVEEEIVVPSHAFVRWWFVDRAVFVWNFFIGYYIQDSPLQWLTYVLLGAKIHPSTKIDTTLQEFDLIQIDENTSVGGNGLRCSKFAYCNSNGQGLDSKKVLKFRSITIQANCEVEGHLSPGVLVGKASVVEPHSVVAEGGQVPCNVTVCGNPAYVSGSAGLADTTMPSMWWQLGFMKIVSYPILLYFVVGCLVLAFTLIKDQIIWEWRYGPIFLAGLSGFVGLLFSVLLNILLKWLLIGKKHVGPYNDNLYHKHIDWFVDYHFKVSSYFLGDLTSNSRSWNFIMKLYGMDVDLISNIVVYNYPPSKVDLISLKGTFSSAALYKVKKGGEYFQTKLIESSIGWNAYVGPGVEINRGILYPLSVTKHDVIRNEKDTRAVPEPILRYAIKWILTDLVYLGLFCSIAFASIPTYELYLSCFVNLSSIFLAIPVASLLMVVQSIMMLLVLNVFQLLTFAGSNRRSEPWSYPLHIVLVTANWSMQRYNILPLTLGTPLYIWIAKFLGSSFSGKGHVLFWGIVYDFPYLTIEDNTIVDSAGISGHFVVHKNMTLGPAHVSGIVHPMTFMMANTTITGEKETGPWMAPVPLTRSPEHENSIIDVDLEAQSVWSNDMESELIESSMYFQVSQQFY